MAGEDSKLAILNAAKSIFSRKGYTGTSIRDIANLASVNHAIIRYHYGNKEGLWIAVVSDLIQEGVNLRLQYPFTPDTTDRASLIKSIREFTRIRIAHFSAKPELVKLIFLINLEGGERFERMDSLLRQAYAGTQEIVGKMITTGVLKDINFNDLYFMLPSLMGGRFIHPNFDVDDKGNKIDIEEVIDGHTDLVMQFIIKPE